MASIKKNFLLSSAYQLLTIITPILTTPYLSRVIGAEGSGAFAYTQSVANYFVLFAVLGMSSYGVRAIAECGANRAKRSQVFWNAFAMNLIVGSVVVAVYIWFLVQDSTPYRLLYIIWGLWILGSIFDVSWLFFGMQDFSIPTVRNFVTKICSVGFILLFVRHSSDVWAYVAAIAGSSFANSVLIWPFVSRYVDYVKPDVVHVKKHFKPNLTLFVPVIAISFYSILDKVMLGGIAGMEETGYFEYAEKITKMPMAVITALGAAVLPKMTEIMSAGKMVEGRKLVTTTMWFMLVCSNALCFGIVGVAPSFVPFFFGDGFGKCVMLMSVLAFVIPMICITNVVGSQYLLPSHRDREYTLSVITGAIANVAINILLIPRIGALGAAIGSVACEAVVMIVQIAMVYREFEITAIAKKILPYFLIGATMAMALRFANAMMSSTVPEFAKFIIEFAIGATLYSTLSIAWAVKKDIHELRQIFPKSFDKE